MPISSRDASQQLIQDSTRITDVDVLDVLDRTDELKQTVANNGPLKRFVRDVKLMSSLVKDYCNGRYRELPWWAIASITAALTYVLSPVDLIPDIIPVFGFIDDALVLSACLGMVELELEKYETWKNRLLN